MKEGRERIDEESSLRDMKPKDTVSASLAFGPNLKELSSIHLVPA